MSNTAAEDLGEGILQHSTVAPVLKASSQHSHENIRGRGKKSSVNNNTPGDVLVVCIFKDQMQLTFDMLFILWMIFLRVWSLILL